MTSPTIADRFPTAATSRPPTNDQVRAVARLQGAVILLAEAIDELVPEGRDKSIALTSLEDTLMRANRGVFTGHPAGGVDVSANTVEVPAGGVAKGGIVIATTNAGCASVDTLVELYMTDPGNEPVATAKRLVGAALEGEFDCCLTGTCA